MAVTLVPNAIDRVGTVAYSAPTQALDTVSNQVANNGAMWLELKNSGASTYTVTFTLNGTIDGVASPGKVVSLAAGADKIVGPFPTSEYGTTLNFVAQNVAVLGKAYQLTPNR